jgi:hypothetical protein
MRSNAIAFDSQLFKQQQSILVLLNLGVLAGLVLVHVSFLSLLGVPSLLLLIVVTGRFLALIAELLWLQSTGELQPSLVAIYKHLTIWVNIAFAYGPFIMAGEYSIDDCVWLQFTSDEIRTIEELVDATDGRALRK